MDTHRVIPDETAHWSGSFILAAGSDANMEITRRHHLRADDIAHIRDRIEGLFGVRLEGDQFEAVEFADMDRDIVLVDGEPLVMRTEAGDLLTVRGANQVDPSRRVVVVDAGAVAFVSDGADIMRPGIVDADEAIEPGDPVLIAEETHGKILAVGHARVAGSDLRGSEGKVIDTLHHVGDDLFDFSG